MGLIPLLALACRHAAPNAAADGARGRDLDQLRPAEGAPIAWDLVFEREAEDLWFWDEGGRAWGHTGSELLALSDDGTVRWRHGLQDPEFLRVSDDGRVAVLTDFLGCFAWHDAETGERLGSNPYVIDPDAWTVTDDGAEVWTFDLEGRLIARRRDVVEPIARIEVPHDESGSDLVIEGDLLYVKAPNSLVARRLPDGAVLGQHPWFEGSICRVDDDRVWVLDDDEDETRPVPLDPRTLAPLGPAADVACGPTSPLSWEMYGAMLHHPDGTISALGSDFDEAMLRADGTLWLVGAGRWTGWRPTRRGVRTAWLDDYDAPFEVGDSAVTIEGTRVDQLLVAPPQRDTGPTTLYEAVRRPDGELWIWGEVDGRRVWIAVGPP